MRGVTKLATIVCFWLLLVSSATAAPEEKKKDKLVGESKSWKVEVVSAEYGMPGDSIPGDPMGERFAYLPEGKCFLFLKLRFEYKGPDADVSGPRVTLVNDKDEEFRNAGNLRALGGDSFIALGGFEWILNATHPDPKDHTTVPLKTGDRFGNPWLEFLIVIPTDSKDLRLIFGGEEISGIRITPTKIK